jgi:hypothetical protein
MMAKLMQVVVEEDLSVQLRGSRESKVEVTTLEMVVAAVEGTAEEVGAASGRELQIEARSRLEPPVKGDNHVPSRSTAMMRMRMMMRRTHPFVALHLSALRDH